MARKKKMIAMLLAGGEGKRLGILTRDLAKPAVHFGGKYRIIDFTLSNCTHSGIDTVGVLTQYQPLDLNHHLGIGSPWGLDRRDGGMAVLPPYVQKTGGMWYKGTANAIYQNISFIERYSPEYVLVISGDHIYKMNYDLMLQEHQAKNADVSIACIEVPWKEASRFGIMKVDEEGVVVDFLEKPKDPPSNLASMGIYIFTWSALREYLIRDEEDPYSSNDFGKDIIPSMLENGLKVQSYNFKGYWKDVGTLESLWEANMDLLSDDSTLELHDKASRIYSVNPNQPGHFVGVNANIDNSLINEGCVIEGLVHHSVLFNGVRVNESAEVRDSVIMPNVTIKAGVQLKRVIIGEGTVIGEGVVLGNDSGDVTVIGNDQVITVESLQEGV